MTATNPMRHIAITGASSEIGLAIAQALVSPDDHAVLQTVNKASTLQEAFPASRFPWVNIVSANLADPQALQAFCLQVGNADLLVNAAAVTNTDLLPSLEEDAIDAMIAVNITAFTRITKAAVAGMMRRRRGAIINVSSIAATRANRGQTVYAGTKGYMESFSRALAAEAGARGVRINCVAPGTIEAGTLRTLLVDARDEVLSSNVLKRLGTPQDVAQAVQYLASDASAFVNGQVLHVDGGFCRGI